MKNIIFTLIATFTLLAVSCEPNTSSKGDDIYEDDIENDELE
ncbi:hypothetical protein [Aurantibacter sp.]